MFSFALNVYLPLTEENPFIGLRCLVSSNLSRKHERRKSLILDDTSRKLSNRLYILGFNRKLYNF